MPPRTDEATARRWILGDADRRAHGLSLDLVLEVDGRVAGEVGLADIDVAARTADIGWWVAPAHRGDGIAAPACGPGGPVGLDELCVDTVLARCAGANPASGRVARSAGFTHVADSGGDELWTLTVSSGATLEV